MSVTYPRVEIWFRRSEVERWTLYELAYTLEEAQRVVGRASGSHIEWQFECREGSEQTEGDI